MVTLVILDGFGINKKKYGNAIKLQTTPYLNKLKGYRKTTLKASGEEVGLSAGQMGNSEVGHLNLGAGRIVFQDLPKINNQIKNKQFFENAALLKAIDHANKNASALHLVGLLSDGGVHSHISHLKALVELAKQHNVEKVYIHAILDGRDTLKNSGLGFVRELEDFALGKAEIASLCGRIYAMDREKRWDRVNKAYDMLCLGRAENYYQNAQQALEDSYKNNIFDEFVEPTIIGKAKTIDSGDSVIFFNFRSDRAREITEAITNKNFNEFETKKLDDLCYVCMTEYSDKLTNVLVAYPPEKIEDNLSAILSQNGKKQFHISETTKYAHVTFFFNGGIEEPYSGEVRKLIESENVKNFAETPKMKAFEITEQAISEIASGEYDFVLINLSNADMIGHTGELEPAKQAVAVVDKCAYALALATLAVGGDCIITADHGNIEEMLDKKGNVLTQHTTNDVPLWLISQKHKKKKLKKGKLANVAPTILKLLDMDIPNNMEKPLF
ncbi:MAG: 2,3-bisphosphoglycerate-independent phosphoglycerate mutase [Clostridia bacterium]|nr:2,3-bisphosphoglycerate-independent phosphoglycerate mutase [Clostridia bacterium]